MAINASVLKLQVEDKEYEASLKKAKEGLAALQQSLQNIGGNFTNASKNAVEYTRNIGKMETTAKTAKGRIGEMSSAFTELRMQYSQLTAEEKSSPFGRALNDSLNELKTRTQEAKKALEDVNKELNAVDETAEKTKNDFGNISDMMSVFGGNLMTKGAELAMNALSRLGDEIVDTAQKAVQMSTQAEGIRMAFERLNRPGLLDQLREATHGTVSDLQLMQAAVKFDDFNLSLSELGTMLAFAQQKAKDTGQSVEFLVDSIVNGLGRQSTQILDNLGLSQSEVKERTKETGDMTTAVGQIIREQMSSAGDYVETAADRASRANAEYENSLIELGDEIRKTFGIGSMEEFNMYLKNELVKNLKFTVDTFQSAEDAAKKAWSAYTQLTAPLDSVYTKMEEIANSNAVTKWYFRIQSLVYPLTQVYNMVKLIGNELGLSGGGGGGGLGGVMRNATGIMNQNRDRVHGGSYTVVSSGGKVVSATHRGANGGVIDYTALEQSRQATAAGGKKTGGGGGRRGGGGGSTSKTEEKELTIQQQIAKLEEEALTATDARREEIAKTVQELDKELDRQKKIKEELHKGQSLPDGDFVEEGDTRSPAEIMRDSVLANMRDNMAQVDDKTMRTLMQTALENGIEGIDWTSINELMWEGMDVPDEKWQEIQDQINERLKELDIAPIDVDLSTGNVKKETKEMTKDWSSAASAIQSVGSAMSQIENPAAKVLGTIAQAIATIALTFAKSLEGTVTPWDWIAGAAAGTATMLSTIAAIKSSTSGGFAGGGIVPGNNLSGDNLRTSDYGINSGELILNAAQQNSLAGLLTGGGMQNMNLTASVSGEQLRFVLNNNGKRTGRGEYVTTKFR